MLLELVIIIASAKIAGGLASRFKQPAVLGELLVGLILGPSLFNVLHPSDTLTHLAEIGVILLMFIAGLETDVEQLQRAGGTSLVTAVGGVLLPMGAGFVAAFFFGYSWQEALFIGTILTATSVSISVQTLLELNQLKSREGMVILGAAVIDDVLGIIVVTLVLSLGHGANGVALLLIKMLAFFVLTFLLGGKLIHYSSKIARYFQASEGLASFALVVCFFIAWVSEHAGVASITGAYIAGILFAKTHFAHQISDKVSTIAYSFFTPIFFLNIGINAELHGMNGLWKFAALIVALSIVTKIVGCGLGSFITGFNFRQSLAVGVGMISRGEVALITASIGLHNGLLSNQTFSVMVLMVLATTIVTPPLLKLSFRPLG